jgi:hypothetical protein
LEASAARPPEASARRHRFADALVSHQPGRERAGRLGARPAINGDLHLAVLDEQPGGRIAR